MNGWCANACRACAGVSAMQPELNEWCTQEWQHVTSAKRGARLRECSKDYVAAALITPMRKVRRWRPQQNGRTQANDSTLACDVCGLMKLPQMNHPRSALDAEENKRDDTQHRGRARLCMITRHETAVGSSP